MRNCNTTNYLLQHYFIHSINFISPTKMCTSIFHKNFKIKLLKMLYSCTTAERNTIICCASRIRANVGNTMVPNNVASFISVNFRRRTQIHTHTYSFFFHSRALHPSFPIRTPYRKHNMRPSSTEQYCPRTVALSIPLPVIYCSFLIKNISEV